MPEQEKRTTFTLSQEQLEEIAERGATRAIEKATNELYAGIGKRGIAFAFTIIGTLILGSFFWLQSKGIFK